MKILAIRGKNLASLASFDVALESGPLERVGIFAITGPTGAGKSTLLDAMCVALFDRTPRLSNLAGVPVGTADQDDAHRVRANDVRGLLRRGTGEGFAEVDFLGRDDRGYRSRWEVRRARRSPTGKLQKISLTLTELESGRVVSSGNKTETLAVIENCLGLSFEQFRRSALLAQNDFAAFLRADKNERAALLERMTGTEVYSKVSVAAFQRAAEEAKSLELLQEAADTSSLLSDVDRTAMLAQQVALKTQSKASAEALQSLQTAIRYYAEHRKASLSLEQGRVRMREATQGLAALAPAQEELRLSRQARRYSGLIDATKLRRQEAAAAIAAQDAAKVELHDAEQGLRDAGGKRAAVVHQIEETRARYIAELSREQQELRMRLDELAHWLGANEDLRAAGGELAEFTSMAAAQLDTLAPSLHAALTQHDQSLAKLASECEQSKIALEAAKRDHSALRETHAALGIGALRALVTGLADELRELQGLGELVERARKTKKLLVATHTQMAELRLQIAESQDKSAAAALSLTSMRDQLGEAERSYDSIRIALDLSEQRSQLKDGENCPLCGSEEHPFAKGGELVSSIVGEQRARVETLRTQLDALTTSAAKRESTLASSTETLERIGREGQGFENELVFAIKTFSDSPLTEPWRDLDLCDPTLATALPTRRNEREDLLKDKQATLGSGEQVEAKMQAQALLVEAKQREWDTLRDRVAESERGQRKARERHASCQSERYRSRMHERQAAEGRLQIVASKLAGAATAPFPEIEARLQLATLAEQEAGKRVAGAQRGLQNASERIVDTQKAIEDCDRDLENALDTLDCSWPEFGRRLSISEATMQATEDALLAARKLESESQGSLQQCIERLAELDSQGKPTHSEEQAQRELPLVETRIEEQGEVLLELGAKLKSDGQARAARDDLDKRLHKAIARAHTFRTLSDLIGSADGKKFRVFAQSLTLDTLLQGANQHLAELSPRYLLQRVPGHDLDLQIVDRDLGDDVRSVNSLSGGEGFLISLALALGLSSLASREVRVESLLVDEGFGSLDEDTLEIALGVLDTLQATGRKVGLISHVPGFADRIGAQVRVIPQGNGRSSVQVF